MQVAFVNFSRILGTRFWNVEQRYIFTMSTDLYQDYFFGILCLQNI